MCIAEYGFIEISPFEQVNVENLVMSIGAQRKVS